MNQNKLNSNIGRILPHKRRGVAEVISTLLLVVITVVGAVILTTFIDETFVAGSLAVTSSTDSTIKTIKLIAYDTRDGQTLMGYTDLDNEHTINPDLCRENCLSNRNPENTGSEFLVFQIENRAVYPIYLKNVYLDNVNHNWDSATVGKQLDGSVSPLAGGAYPSDGTFSILSDDITDEIQKDQQILNGETVNVVVKLHAADVTIPDIDLSKTIRVQLNIGENSLSEFLIETGDAR